MRKLLSVWMVILLSLCLVITDAQAKRFGGGRSFGTYRSNYSFSRAQPIRPVQNQNVFNRNRWLAPLTGLALGGLLASLFMGHGLMSGLFSWLLVGGCVLLLLNLIRSFSRRTVQSTPSGGQIYNMQPESNSHYSPRQYAFNNSTSVPADFDETEFLRAAKLQFIRLQNAYDKKNLEDISLYTTPEVFAEIKLQLQERGEKSNQTDVVTLDATLLEATNEHNASVASVRFSGLIKEEPSEPSHSFEEVWHFRKENDVWLTSGIQQV